MMVRAAALIGLLALAGCGPGSTPHGAPSQQTDAAPNAAPLKFDIGDHFGSTDYDFAVDKVTRAKSVGITYVEQTAAEGGVFIVAHYRFKNTSQAPLAAASTPDLKLIDGRGTVYSADDGATGMYLMTHKMTQKLMSDINPGITVEGARVFEVSATDFNPATWSLQSGEGGPRIGLAKMTTAATTRGQRAHRAKETCHDVQQDGETITDCTIE